MTADLSSLQTTIERLHAAGADADRDEARTVFATFRAELSSGRVRSAVPDPGAPTGWKVNTWVKQGILVGFRCGDIAPFAGPDPGVPFLDKDTLPLKPLAASSRVRLVPGGSSIRDGAYVGEGVICMPPMFINIGAYVGENSLIDSHALVGSCAQVGQRVHVSAGAQIGGVLEPIGALPVIIEDDALVGGSTGIYEGAVVKARAVIAAGTVLTGSTPVYDLPRQRVIRREAGSPLVIPEGAVVVPGTRAVTADAGREWGLSLATPVIVKYRDDKTDTGTELEAWLR
ncbi:MAG: 2,3,4,5-tetrahydropyridine-2,6-dicarboxylate N-succinyltransferase [Vicinamibacterales bacterium]|nr:2,3,4,5-tetrahydropyridine-2,6-dicarboxylate N-succinyltransferase [Vicinamibacterales bacterium]